MEVNVKLLKDTFHEIVEKRGDKIFNDSDLALWFAHYLLLAPEEVTIRTQSGKQKFDLIISWKEVPHCYCFFRFARDGWPSSSYRTERKKLTEAQIEGGCSFFFLAYRGEYPEQIEKMKELFEDDGVTTFIERYGGGAG